MLSGIDPILVGELLLHLDSMGHSDAVVVADAHFPAARLAKRIVTLPALSSPDVVAAIRSVLPLDDAIALDLMAAPDASADAIHAALVETADTGPGEVRLLERRAFYEAAADAFVVVRTGELRTYANAILYKGVVRP